MPLQSSMTTHFKLKTAFCVYSWCHTRHVGWILQEMSSNMVALVLNLMQALTDNLYKLIRCPPTWSPCPPSFWMWCKHSLINFVNWYVLQHGGHVLPRHSLEFNCLSWICRKHSLITHHHMLEEIFTKNVLQHGGHILPHSPLIQTCLILGKKNYSNYRFALARKRLLLERYAGITSKDFQCSVCFRFSPPSVNSKLQFWYLNFR